MTGSFDSFCSWFSCSGHLAFSLDGIVSALRASLVAQTVKNLPAMQENWVRSPGWEDPLEKGVATHSSIFAWRVPWTEEPDGLQSMGCKESDTTERITLH